MTLTQAAYLQLEKDDSSIPWKSNHHFFKVAFRTTIILVGVYHLPKGTTIVKMVVDFQGIAVYDPLKSIEDM